MSDFLHEQDRYLGTAKMTNEQISLKAERDRYKKALEEIVNLNLTKTTDGGGARDLNMRWRFAEIAEQALKDEEK